MAGRSSECLVGTRTCGTCLGASHLWSFKGNPPQLLQDLQECPTQPPAPQPQGTTVRSPERPGLSLLVDIFHRFKAWAEICCPLRSLLPLASPKTDSTSAFDYFCCWLPSLPLTASVHKLHPEALTQPHGKFAGRRDE